MGFFNMLANGAFGDTDAGKVFGALFKAAETGQLTKADMDGLDAIPEGTSRDGDMTITKTTNRVDSQGRTAGGPTPSEAKSNAPSPQPRGETGLANRLYGK